MSRTALLAGLVLVVAACGPARDSGQSGSPRAVVARIPHAEVTAEIAGATPQQEQILREVVAGLGRETRIESISVNDLAAADATSAPESDVRGAWEAELVVQAFGERSRDLGLAPPRALLVRTEGGTVVDESYEAEAPTPSRRSVTAMVLAAKVASGAREGGARVVGLELLEPKRLALAVRIQADDPVSFLSDRADRFLSTVPSPWGAEYDGLLVELADTRGRLVWSHYWTVSDDGGGTEWGYVQPGLEGCDPVDPVSAGPPGKPPPPPCPAGDKTRDADVTTEIVGASREQEKLLRAILAGLEPPLIARVRVEPAKGSGWTSDDPNAVVVHVDRGKTEEKDRADWEASLLGGVFDDRSEALHLPEVAALETVEGGVALDGPDPPPPPLDGDPITREQLTAQVAAAAETSGAEIAELRILEPHHLAPIVVLRVEDPAGYLRNGLMTFLLALPDDEVALDGSYLRVTDRRGKFVWLSAGTESSSISGGMHGVRPDLKACDPDPGFGSPMRPPPPPCPADERLREAVETAVLRYETSTGRHVRKVDCADSNVRRFRYRLAFPCKVVYEDTDAGAWFACFALVDKALYQVGGCLDSKRDLGVGKGRLLSRDQSPSIQ